MTLVSGDGAGTQRCTWRRAIAGDEHVAVTTERIRGFPGTLLLIVCLWLLRLIFLSTSVSMNQLTILQGPAV